LGIGVRQIDVASMALVGGSTGRAGLVESVGMSSVSSIFVCCSASARIVVVLAMGGVLCD
jgi:hypothetical protein